MGSPVIWNGTTGKVIAPDGLVDINGVAIGGGGGDAFTTIQPDAGTSPVADASNDTLTLTSADGSLVITGDSSTDTLDFALTTNLTRNGAASTPALKLRGTPYTAGTTTTNKALLLLEPTGATSASWNAAGTYLGINAATGFTGNLADFQLNGVSKFAVTYEGVGYFAGASVTATGLFSSANNVTLNLGLNRSYTSASQTQIKMANQTDSSSSGSGTAVAITPTYNQTSTAGATDLLINRTETAVGSGSHYLFDAQVGGTSKVNIDRTGTVYASQSGESRPSFWITSHTGGKFGMGYNGAYGGILAYDTVPVLAWTATSVSPLVLFNCKATQNAGSPGLVFSNDFNTGFYSPGADKIAASTNGTKRFEITTAAIDFSVPLQMSATQVLTTRQTGWAAATGTATRSTFDTTTVTTAQLAEHVKALIDDLITHGMIGA